MKCLSEQSEYNSSEQEDNIKPIQKQENIASLANIRQIFKPAKFEDTQQISLKPKFVHEQNHHNDIHKQKGNPSKVMSNASKVSLQSRKSLISAYTFKRQGQQKLKKHDPVSLYAQTRQSWNSNKFLKSRADAKEGRKLQLDKRNRLQRIY